MHRFFPLILIVLALNYGIAGQNRTDLPKTNFNLFSDILGKGLGMIEDEITILGKEKIYKLDSGRDSEMNAFFMNVFRQKFAADRIVYGKNTDSCDYLITVSNLDLKVRYTRPEGKSLLGEEFTERIISVSFDYIITRNGSAVSGKRFSENYKDSVNVKDYEYVQNKEFSFMNSELPEKSFLGKVFVPAVVVLSSAAAVILFFTIRSK